MKRFFSVFVLMLFFGACEIQQAKNEPKRGQLLNVLYNTYIEKAHLTVDLSVTETGRFELSFFNNTEERFYLFISDTPEKGLEKDLFKVYDGVEFVSYTGKVVRRIKSEDNWIPINSGESKTYEFNIDKSYDFIESADYEVYYDSFITLRYVDRTEQNLNAISNTVTNYIDYNLIQKDIALPKAACSAAQSNSLNGGRNGAGDMSDNAEAYLAKYGADKFYVRWFGVKNNQRWNHVVNGYERMSPTFRRRWDYSCENTNTTSDCRGYVAWVYKSRPYQVWVCMNHYNRYNDRDKASLMIHEASHWDIAFGSDDHVYGYQNGINLARNSPNKAVDCANNIEYYAWEIPQVDDPPPPPPDDGEIKLNKTKFAIGESIVVTYSGLPGNDRDWIGIYEKGAPHDHDMVRRYTDGKKNGTMTFEGLNEAGKYEVRLYFDDSYILEDGVNFQVVGDDGPPPPDGDGEIEMDKTNFMINKRIKVKYSKIDISRKYFIGLFPRGTSNNDNPIAERKVEKVEGKKIFKLKKPGKFEVHLYLDNSDYIIDKEEFNVYRDTRSPKEES